MRKHIQDTIEAARAELAKGNRIAAREAAATAAREATRAWLRAGPKAGQVYSDLCTEAGCVYQEAVGT